jgi:chemotaxis protein CheZ
MTQPPDRRGYTDSDYEAIAGAVEETARGRWFLAEHAKRTRHADTQLVLAAIERLEQLVAHRPQPELDRLRRELIEMAEIITRTRAEIAAIHPEQAGRGNLGQASNELDAIVETTERATSEILSAAEHIQEIAWTLRERGADPAMCDRIDALTTETYTACSFQDLTGQRTRKVIDALRFLERRLNAMIAIWLEAPTGESARGPASAVPVEEVAAPALDDTDVFEPDAEVAVEQKSPPAEKPAPKSQSELDMLTLTERMALFS